MAAEGRLWTWTVQRFQPPSPPYALPANGFQPFALGYIEVDGGGRVAAVLDVPDLDSVYIGMRMRVEQADGRVPRAIPVEEGK